MSDSLPGSVNGDRNNETTPYIETELLLAQMNGEHERRDALLAEMYPGERAKLARDLENLLGYVKASQQAVNDRAGL